MASTLRCSRDGKEYLSADVVMIGNTPVAKVNLTDEEKKKLGIVDAPKEPEAPQTTQEPAPSTPEGGDKEPGTPEGNPQVEGAPAVPENAPEGGENLDGDGFPKEDTV